MILVILNDWLYAAYLKWTYPPWIAFCWCECDVCHQCMASDLCDRSALGHAKSVTLSRVTQSEWPLIRCDSLHVNIDNHYSNIQYSLPMSLVWPWGVSEAALSCRQARSQDSGPGVCCALHNTTSHQRSENKKSNNITRECEYQITNEEWVKARSDVSLTASNIHSRNPVFVCMWFQDTKRKRHYSLWWKYLWEVSFSICDRGPVTDSDWKGHQNDSWDQHARCQDASSELRRYETRNISIYNKLWPIPPPSIVPGRSYSALCRPPSRLCNIITQHMLCNTVCITSKDVKSSIAAGSGLCYGGCWCRHVTRSCTALCTSLGLTILWLYWHWPESQREMSNWWHGPPLSLAPAPVLSVHSGLGPVWPV